MARRVEITEALRHKLIRNEFGPGAGIPEEAVAAEFGTSRTPIREALIVLSREGIVTNEANRGFRVASISIEALRSYFEVAQVIHGPTIRLMRQRASTSELADMKAFLDPADVDPAERSLLHFQMMYRIATLSRNIFFEQSIRAGEAYYGFVRMSVVKGLSEPAAAASSSDLLQHERNILAALDSGSDLELDDALEQMTEGARTFLLANLL